MGFEEVKPEDMKSIARDKLKALQEPVDYIVHVEPVPIPFSKRVPFLSRFIKDAAEMSGSVLQLSNSVNTFHHTTAPVALTNGLQFGGVALAALDFILIPAVYLSSWILKKEVPISLNNNARWMFSAILLGLTLTAIFVPVAAPIIAMVTAGFGFALSSFLLTRVIQERYQLGRERKTIENTLAEAESEMNSLQKEAVSLEAELDRCDSEELTDIYHRITLLQARHKEQKDLISELKGKQIEVDEKIKAVGIRQIVDKSLGIMFSAVAVSGLVVSLFFPPIGLTILAAVSLASLAYISVRVAVPLVSSIVTFVQSKLQKSSEADSVAPDNEHSNKVDEALASGNSYSFIADHLPTERSVTPPPSYSASEFDRTQRLQIPDECDALEQESRARADSVDSFYSIRSVLLDDADAQDFSPRQRSDSLDSFHSAQQPPSYGIEEAQTPLDTKYRLKAIKNPQTVSTTDDEIETEDEGEYQGPR